MRPHLFTVEQIVKKLSAKLSLSDDSNTEVVEHILNFSAGKLLAAASLC